MRKPDLLTRLIALALPMCLAACVPAPTRELTPTELYFLKEYTARPGDGPITQMDDDEAREFLASIVDHPVDLHGIALTADGEPLAGAKVRALVLNKPLRDLVPPYLTGPISPTQVTRADGRFRIQGLNGAAALVEVVADDHAPIGDARRIYFLAPEIKDSNEEPLPTAEQPAEFYFRPLHAGELRSFSTGAVPLQSNGEAAEIMLRQLTPYGVKAGTGELSVSLTLGEADDQGRYDWRVVVSVPNGGIQSYQDIRNTRAPLDGYDDELVFTISKDQENWNHRGERDFFLRLEDGTYARARIKVRTMQAPYFSVTGKWNAAGRHYVF